MELSYVFRSRYLIGRTPYVIKWQLIDRVCTQFGRIQRIPHGSGTFA